MATLLGNSSINVGSGDNTGGGAPQGSQSVCGTSGTVDTILGYFTGVGGVSVKSVQLGILADSANTPGALLSGGEGTFTDPGGGTWTNLPAWVSVTGLSAAVVSGTKYWLMLLCLPAGASSINFPDFSGGSTPGAFTAAATYTDLGNAITWTTTGSATWSPLSLYATGTPAGSTDLNVNLIN